MPRRGLRRGHRGLAYRARRFYLIVALAQFYRTWGVDRSPGLVRVKIGSGRIFQW